MSAPVQYKLALPPDVKAWVEREAKVNLRSQSAQIVHILRKEMAAGSEFGDLSPAAETVTTDERTSE